MDETIHGLWEYIAVYVDDLAFVVREPKTVINLLKENTNKN